MRYHEGNACVLRAVRTIEAGEEITDNYGFFYQGGNSVDIVGTCLVDICAVLYEKLLSWSWSWVHYDMAFQFVFAAKRDYLFFSCLLFHFPFPSLVQPHCLVSVKHLK